jgi:hypothetical protein
LDRASPASSAHKTRTCIHIHKYTYIIIVDLFDVGGIVEEGGKIAKLVQEERGCLGPDPRYAWLRFRVEEVRFRV